MADESLTAFQKAPRPCKSCGVVFAGARCMECWRAYCLVKRATEEHKQAARELSAAHYQKNKEKLLAASKERRKANPEHYKLRAREDFQKNKAAYLARSKKSRQADPVRAAAYARKWAEKNPIARRLFAQNRRARERNAGGRLSKGLAEKLLELQKGKCPCCKQPLGDDYHLDHKMPLALGGTNTDDNMQLLRARCNLQKSKAHPIDFMQSRGFLL